MHTYVYLYAHIYENIINHTFQNLNPLIPTSFLHTKKEKKNKNFKDYMNLKFNIF